MKKSSEKRAYLIILTVISLVFSIIGALVFRFVCPQNYFIAYPLIPTYFYLFGLLFIYLFERIYKNIQQRTLLLYVSLRMMKLMVSIVVLIIYGVLIKDQVVAFMFTFVAFYLLYLILEILFFYNFERHEEIRMERKKKRKQIKKR